MANMTPNPREKKPSVIPNPREAVKTPAQTAAANVPTTYKTPGRVQPGQSQSQLRSLSNTEATNIQQSHDDNKSQNYTAPGMITNPRDQQNAANAGGAQVEPIGGNTPTPGLEFGSQLSQTPAPTTASTTPGAPTGESGMTPEGATTGTPTTIPPEGTTGAQSSNIPSAGEPLPETVNEGAVPGTTPDAGLEGNAALIDQATKNQLEGADQYLTEAQKMAQQNLDVAENARRLQIIGTLNGTNAQAIAQSMGVNLTDMTTAQLENLLVNSGLEPSKAAIDRISQEGAAAIDSVKMEAGDLLAQNKYTADQISRTLGRSVDDRERFNINQDAKLKKLAAIYGGGSSSLSGNTAILQAQEQGQRALEDLNAEYAGRMDLIGRQANAIVRQAAEQTRQINTQVQDGIQAKYAQVQEQAQKLIADGVANQKDYNTAMAPILKEYIGFYNDATKWGAEQQIANQKTVFDQIAKLRDQQAAEDKALSDSYGVVFQNGQPVVGADGKPVSTFDSMKFQTEQANDMYQFDAKLEQDAQQFSQRLGFDVSKEQFSQVLEQAKFSQNQMEFETNTGIKLSEMEYQQLKDSADREVTMAKEGLGQSSGVDTTVATNSFNPTKSKYGVTPTANGIEVNVETKMGANGKPRLTGARVQCGEYVNDAIGIPSYFGDSLESKKKRITSQTPTPGAAFITSDGGTKYGHVGIVEEVRPDGTIIISESNYDDQGSFRRKEYASLEEFKAKRPLLGFTGGLKEKQGLEKKTDTAGVGGVVGQAIAKLPSEIRSTILPQVTQYKSEPVVKNFSLATEAYNIAKALEKDPSGISDTALIFAYAKAQDPDSVVRDSEYATVSNNANSWSEQLGVNAARVADGTETLSPEARKKIVETIKTQYETRKKSAEYMQKQYSDTIFDLTGDRAIGDSLLKNYDTASESTSSGGFTSKALESIFNTYRK